MAESEPWSIPEPHAPECEGECVMFGPEQPEGPGSCRESCRRLRGEPSGVGPDIPDKLFHLTMAAVTLIEDRDGMILAECAENARKAGDDRGSQTFRRALMKHALDRLDAGAFDPPPKPEGRWRVTRAFDGSCREHAWTLKSEGDARARARAEVRQRPSAVVTIHYSRDGSQWTLLPSEFEPRLHSEFFREGDSLIGTDDGGRHFGVVQGYWCGGPELVIRWSDADDNVVVDPAHPLITLTLWPRRAHIDRLAEQAATEAPDA